MVVNKLTFLTFFCIIYMIMLLIIYFSKERIKNAENKVYVIMMIANIIGLVLQNLSAYFSYNYNNYPPFITEFIVKLYLTYFLDFGFLLLFYIIVTANKNNKFKALNIYMSMMLLLSFIILFLPLDMHLDFENSIFYSTGIACNFTYICGFMVSIIIIVSMIMNRKNVPSRKMIPMLLYLLLTIVAIMVQRTFPDVMIICYIESLVCFLMFHTIENPDMIMVEELTKAQKLSEKTANDKSNFLYTISTDIESRIDKIDGIYNNIVNANSEEESKYYLTELKETLDSSRNFLRRTIDISDMDAKYLQTTNNKYDLKLLLNSVYSIKKGEVKESVDLRLDLSEELPSELYGDSIKLKQILLSVLDNSIKFTEKGSIELRVSSITKNSICRLFFVIEDTGQGIDIYKQNEIMNDNHDLDKEEINNLEGMNLNLKTIRKMINIIGGTFTIDSNSFGGTTVNITLDQRMVIEEKSKEEQNIEKYSETLKNQKTCAIISMDKAAIKSIKNIAKKYYRVTEYNLTKECLDSIRSGNNNYDLILIDEFMDKIDARALLSKLREVESFKGRVMVITKNKDIRLKKELLDLGFDSIVYVPIEKKDLNNKFKNN